MEGVADECCGSNGSVVVLLNRREIERLEVDQRTSVVLGDDADEMVEEIGHPSLPAGELHGHSELSLHIGANRRQPSSGDRLARIGSACIVSIGNLIPIDFPERSRHLSEAKGEGEGLAASDLL